MEKSEDILSALEELSEKRPATIPELLEEYLSHVARTGKTIFSWKLMKPLLLAKTEEVLDIYGKHFKKQRIPHHSNMENVLYDRHRTLIMDSLHQLDGIPFSVQRVCELLLSPRQNYKRADKYLRALFKNVSVASIIDPEGNNHVPLLRWKLIRGKLVCAEQGTGSSSAEPSSASANASSSQAADTSDSERLAAAVSEGSVTSASSRRERLKRKRQLAIKIASEMCFEPEWVSSAPTPSPGAVRSRMTMLIGGGLGVNKSGVQEDALDTAEDDEENPVTELPVYDSDKENSTGNGTKMRMSLRERKDSQDIVPENSSKTRRIDPSALESETGEFDEDEEAESRAETSWSSDSMESSDEMDDCKPFSDDGSPERTSPKTPPTLSSQVLDLSLGYSPLSPIPSPDSDPPSPKLAGNAGTKIKRVRLWYSPVKSAALVPSASETAASSSDVSEASLSHPSKPEALQTTSGTSAQGGEMVESSVNVPGERSASLESSVPSATPSPQTSASSVPSSVAEGAKESVFEEGEQGENRTVDVAGPTERSDDESSSSENTDTEEKSDLSVLKESDQEEAGDVGVSMEQGDDSESPDSTDNTVPEEGETGDLNAVSDSENPEQHSGHDEPGPEPMEED